MAVVAATSPSPSLTFSDHVQELRIRLAWIIGAVALSGGIGYVFRNVLVNFLQKPLNQPLYYFNPAGSFNFIMKLSFFTGAIVAMPIFAWQLVRFIEPALKVKLKTSTLFKLIGSVVALALAGVTFAYYIIVPTSLQFFAKYASGQIKPLISADDYLSFIISCLVTFAVMFQIPLIILFINRITPLPPGKLMRYQRHVVIGAFVLAVLLPFTYDPLTQFAMAVPIVFLFYFSAVLLWVVQRKSRRAQYKIAKAEQKSATSVKPVSNLGFARPAISQWGDVTVDQPVYAAQPVAEPEPAHSSVNQPQPEQPRPRLQPATHTTNLALDGLRRIQTRS